MGHPSRYCGVCDTSTTLVYVRACVRMCVCAYVCVRICLRGFVSIYEI